MSDLITRLLAAKFTGAGRNEAYVLHLPRPFFVVVAVLALIPLCVLPKVDHFMGKGADNVHLATSGEGVGVQGDFLGFFPVIDEGGKPIAGEITVCFGLPVERYQAIRQRVAEQLTVEMVIDGLEPRVLPLRVCLVVQHDRPRGTYDPKQDRTINYRSYDLPASYHSGPYFCSSYAPKMARPVAPSNPHPPFLEPPFVPPAPVIACRCVSVRAPLLTTP